ncbi:hypothetical protein L6164_007918 [Bauhinia variegata]|uniref:Uncharacterized protein n=1 Tax=Bauhinia variegata TaxID=167791 RepID=A0ACB9PDZ0_BAUVA|nr:hypothetical protein L6164_007918 [Bauhinia variegata]
MEDPSLQVSLPQSVEQLLGRICEAQNQSQPNSAVRRELANLGEREAVQLLTRVSKIKDIRNINQYLMRSINNASSDRSPKRTTACISPHNSPGSATRLMFSQDVSSSPVAVSPQGSPLTNPVQAQGLSPEFRGALGELEFRKTFLLLNYIGGESLEKALTDDQIRSWKNLTMKKFESEVCEALKRNGIHVKDRIKSLDWDSGKAHVYCCHVSSFGNLSFKGPYQQNIRSHLQKSLGDENVLIVKFVEEDNKSGSTIYDWERNAVYRNFVREGIPLGLRRYRFFVFKDGGKEEKSKDPTASSVKCYFVRIESDPFIDKRGSYILAKKTVSEARSLFMHVHSLSNVANYMARFSLILSKTLTINVDLSTVDIQTIDDIYCKDECGNIVTYNGKPCIHTDGTGFISEDLALLCPKNVFKGSCANNEVVKATPCDSEHGDTIAMTPPEFHTREPPLLIQVRLFNKGRAIKGTLMVNKKLPQRTIQVRPSMIKVKTDSNISNIQTINSLEVVNASNVPKKTYLSRNLIALLSYGGVPGNFFMNLLETTLEDTCGFFSSKRAALKVLINHGEMDDFISARMVLTGIPLEEPYVQYRLAVMARKEMKGLGGGKLHIADSYYVMGTADPTGCLQPNQVCVILENGQISGTVLVYRNPGLHFGDIHVLEATYVKELESYVGNSKYAIFFPCIGPRNLADEIAGGDFDGDLYWVSRNPQLLEYFNKSDPWIPSSSDCGVSSVNKCDPKGPSEFSALELEEELFEQYLDNRFHPSNAKSVAADGWLAMMDRLLILGNDCMQEKERLKKNMLRLIDIYYEALDAPKKGGKVEVPSDLGVELFPHYMERNNSFTSNSILGSIYDKVKSHREQYMPMIDITKLSCFDSEIPESVQKKWEKRYSKYRRHMTDALNQDPEGKDEAAEDVIRKYKNKLYGTEENPKAIEDVCYEAIAIYNVVYEFAKSKGEARYCQFAWKVAGSTLLNIFESQQGERTLTCVPSVLREIFG